MLLPSAIFMLLVPPVTTAPPITAIAFSPGDKTVVVGSQTGLEIFAWPELVPMRKLETKLLNIHDLAFSPNGELLAACGGEPGTNGQVELFEWPDGKRVGVWHGHDDVVYSVAWSSESCLLAAASADHQVSVSRIERKGDSTKITPELILSGHSRGVLTVAILPNDGFVLSAGIDQSLRVWQLNNGKLRRTLDQHKAAVHALEVRPNVDPQQPMIASASADKTVRLWQPKIGRLVRFAQLPVEPLDIAWTPSGDRLLASCKDGKLRAINPETVEIVTTHSAIDGWAYSVAVARSGKHALVGGSEGQLNTIELTAE